MVVFRHHSEVPQRDTIEDNHESSVRITIVRRCHFIGVGVDEVDACPNSVKRR
jgi:hypothetical protein